MKRICIYVTLGLLGAVSAHAQEINIGQAVIWIAARCGSLHADR